jgi:hypothetical protein
MFGSSTSLEYSDWESSQLLQALYYAQLADETLLRNIRNTIQCHNLIRFGPMPRELSGSFLSDIASATHNCSPHDLMIFYRNSGLRLKDRPLFGQTICIVLRAGRQSSIWAQELTRDERATLFTLRVYLTPLPLSLDCSWLSSPDEINRTDKGNVLTCSNTCTNNFELIWKSVFDTDFCQEFKRDSPLGGIDALCRLCLYQNDFAVSVSARTGGSTPEICGQCAVRLQERFEYKVNLIFAELVDLLEKIER